MNNRRLNQKKAKALRAATLLIINSTPELQVMHAQDTYTQIQREFYSPPKVGKTSAFSRWLKTIREKLVGKHAEKPWLASNQDVLSSGPRFVYLRLKAAFKRGDLDVTPDGRVVEMAR